MKRKYMHMSVLIEGPKQPGNDLNLYLGLLKEGEIRYGERQSIRGTL
jgi:hypothetical protein